MFKEGCDLLLAFSNSFIDRKEIVEIQSSQIRLGLGRCLSSPLPIQGAEYWCGGNNTTTPAVPMRLLAWPLILFYFNGSAIEVGR